MSYVYDPIALVQHPTIKQAEGLPDEPRDYHEFFWEEAIERGRHVQGRERLYTEVCRFDENGDHTVMAKNCPHFDSEDEEGKITRPGWTVQNG